MLFQSTFIIKWMIWECGCILVMCTFFFTLRADETSRPSKRLVRFGISSIDECTRICQKETLLSCTCLDSVHRKSVCYLTIDCATDTKDAEVLSTDRTPVHAINEVPSQEDVHGNNGMRVFKNVTMSGMDPRKRYNFRVRDNNDATTAMKKPRKPRRGQKRDLYKSSNMREQHEKNWTSVEAIRTALHKAVEQEFDRKDDENALEDDLNSTLEVIMEVTRKGYSPEREEQLEKLEKRKHKLKSDLSRARKRFQKSHRKVEDLKHSLLLASGNWKESKAEESKAEESKEETPQLTSSTSTPQYWSTAMPGDGDSSDAQATALLDLEMALKNATEDEFFKKEIEQSIRKRLKGLKKEYRRLNQGRGFVSKIRKLDQLEQDVKRLRVDLDATKAAFHEARKRVADLREQLRQAIEKTKQSQASKFTSPSSSLSASFAHFATGTPLQGQPNNVRAIEDALKNATDDNYAKEDRKLSIIRQLHAVQENISRTMQGPNGTGMMLEELKKEEQKLGLQLSVARQEFLKSTRKVAKLQRELLEAKDDAEAFGFKVKHEDNGIDGSGSELALKKALQQAGTTKPFNQDVKTNQSLHFPKKVTNEYYPKTKDKWSHDNLGKANRSNSSKGGSEMITGIPPGAAKVIRREKAEKERAQRPGVVAASTNHGGARGNSWSSHVLGRPMAKSAPENDVHTVGRRRKALRGKCCERRKNRYGSRIISTPNWLKQLYNQAVQQATLEKEKSLISNAESKMETDKAKEAVLEQRTAASAKHMVRADHRRRDFLYHVTGRASAMERARALQAVLDTFHKKRPKHRFKRRLAEQRFGKTSTSSLRHLKKSFHSKFARDAVNGLRATTSREALEKTGPVKQGNETLFEMEKQKMARWKNQKDSRPLITSDLHEMDGMAKGSFHRSKRSRGSFSASLRSDNLRNFTKIFSHRARRSSSYTVRGHKITRRDEDDANRIRALSNRTFVQLFKDVARLMKERALAASQIHRLMVRQATARKTPVNLKRAHLSKLMESICEKQQEEAALRVSVGKILGILVHGEDFRSIDLLIEKAREATETTAQTTVITVKAEEKAQAYAQEISQLIKLVNQTVKGEDAARRQAEAGREANRSSIAQARSLLVAAGSELAVEEVKIWKEIREVLEKRAEQRERNSKEAAIAEALKQHAEKEASLAQAAARKKQAQASAVSVKLGKILSKESSGRIKGNRSRTKEVAERARLLDLAADDALKKANSSRQRADLAEFIAGLFAEGSTAVRLYELLAKQAHFAQQRADGVALEFDLQKKEAQMDVEEAKAAASAAKEKSSDSNNLIASLAMNKAHLSTRMVALLRNISQLEIVISRRLSRAMRQDFKARKAPEMLEKAAEEAHTEAMKAKVAEKRIHVVEDQLGSKPSKEVFAETAAANKTLQLARERAREAQKAFVMAKHLARTAQNLAETPDVRPRILSQFSLSNSSLSKEEILRQAAMQAEEQAVEEQHVADMLRLEARRLAKEAARGGTAKDWENANHARHLAEQAERRARLVVKEAQFAQRLALKAQRHAMLPSLPQSRSHHGKAAAKEAMKTARQETKDWVSLVEHLKAANLTNAGDVTNATLTGTFVIPRHPAAHVSSNHSHAKHSKTSSSAVLTSLPRNFAEQRPQTDAATEAGARQALQEAEAAVQRARSEAAARQEARQDTLRKLEEEERRFNALSLLSKARRVGDLERLREQADKVATGARVSELNLVAAQAAADAAKEVLQELGD